MTSDLVQVSSDASGNIDFELTYETFDDFIEAVSAAAAWSTDINISGTDIEVTASTRTFSTTTTTLNTNIVVGQWVKVAGFITNTANNGYWQVESVSANAMVVYDPGTALVDDTTGDTVTIDGTMVRNGTTLHSFTIQKHIQDITTPVYFNFTGSCINEMNLNFETGQILKGNFGIMSLDGDSSTSQFGSATFPTINTNTPMNSVSNILNIQQDETVMTQYIQSLSLAINNNIRAQDAIGSLQHIGLVLSRLEVTGNMNIYFDDASMFTKYRNATGFSYSFRAQDLDGNAYVFTFPNVKFETGTVVSGGLDQDMVFNAGWRAIKDATTNCMIQIDKFDA
jgi:hypothetical protein